MSRILLVEGYEGIRDFLSRRLQRRGCDVIVVTDGQQGVDRARAGQSDIVLPDMDLPAMNGWTAARMMDATPEAACVPIVAPTAHAMAGDRGKASAAGCDDCRPRPAGFSRLLARTGELVGIVTGPSCG